MRHKTRTIWTIKLKKVQDCKLAMIFSSRFVISTRRFFTSWVGVKASYFSIYFYLCHPFFTAWVNTFVPAGIICSFSAISAILRRCTNAEIGLLIIQRVVVNVVNFHSFRCIHDYPVHHYHFLFSKQCKISHNIKRFVTWVIMCRPFPLNEKFKHIVVYLSHLVLCELNSFHVFLIENAHLSAGKRNGAGVIPKLISDSCQSFVI